MHSEAISEAVFSGDGRYRYWLAREWDASLPRIAWIMLNPSTADTRRNDPTVERVEGFSTRWGFGSYVVVNLYAFKATDPREMMRAENPAGLPLNADYLAEAMREPCVMLAWGAHGGEWARQFAATIPLLRQGMTPAFVLGVNADGSPKHPLYLKGNTRPAEWRGYDAEPVLWTPGAELTALPRLVLP